MAAVFTYSLVVWIAKPAFDKRLLPYSRPQVPAEYQQTLILSGKDGKPFWTGDGREVYLSNHRAGWNDCRWAFALGKKYWRYDPDTRDWMVDMPMVVNNAREDGWRLCSNQLRKLLAAAEESELRAQILHWNRAKAIVVGLLAFSGLIALFLLTANRRYFRILPVAVFTGWLVVIVADRAAADFFDGPPISVGSLAVLGILLGGVSTFAIACDFFLQRRIGE